MSISIALEDHQTAWFIADLHLKPQLSDHHHILIEFLEHIGKTPCKLFILGDLFDAWIGDDVLEHSSGKAYQLIVKSLKRCQEQGVEIFFQHGNRDFLIGQAFARKSGCNLLPAFQTLNLFNTPTLLTHGDLLCTDDIDYLKLREVLHAPSWKLDFLSKSIEERTQIAELLRQRSQEATKEKIKTHQHAVNQIMDVNQKTVDEYLAAYQSDLLIHGHTHRPAFHTCSEHKRRIVLGDWGKPSGNFLRINRQGIMMLTHWHLGI